MRANRPGDTGGDLFPADEEATQISMAPAPPPVGAQDSLGLDDDTVPPVPVSNTHQAYTPSVVVEPQRRHAPTNDPKLSALRSLSLDKNRPITAPSAATGRPVLPWVLLGLVVSGILVNQFVLPRLRSSGGDSGSAAKAPDEPTTQVVSTSMSGGNGAPLHAAGYIAVRTPIVVGSVAAGRVKALLVKQGDSVKKDQVLAQLDDSAARADYSLAAARLHDAQRILARTRKLKEVEAATAADLDRAVGQVEIASAALAPISRQIEDAKIRSPINGTIMEELVQPGSIVVGNAGIFKLADLTHLIAELDVNEADVSQVHADQKVEVTSDAFPNQAFPGMVREIGEQADRSKGTITIKVYLELTEATLRPGMSVKATLEPTENKARIIIPKAAVDASGNVSVVAPDGSLSKKHVNVQNAGQGRVEVLDGLAVGDRIRIDPPFAPQK